MSTTVQRAPDESAAMFEVTVQLNSWALGDAQIVMTITKELKDAFEALKAPSVEIVPVSEAG